MVKIRHEILFFLNFEINFIECFLQFHRARIEFYKKNVSLTYPTSFWNYLGTSSKITGNGTKSSSNCIFGTETVFYLLVPNFRMELLTDFSSKILGTIKTLMPSKNVQILTIRTVQDRGSMGM